MAENEVANRTLRDVVYGAAVGDALGVPYEFMSRGTFECVGMASGGAHRQPAGTWSDDTSMMLATCDSIRRLGRIDVADMRKRFCQWNFEGAYAVGGVVFDIGNTVATALNEGRGCAGERSNGNGSLMRIAPLAFTDATDDQVRAVSAITHAHRVSTEACVQFVGMLRRVLQGADLREACQGVKVGCWSFDPDVQREQVKSGGFVLDTLGAALWCACNTESYAACVLEAVNLGRDTDTTACVAGALAGALYGFESIPREWLDTLRGKDIIDRDCAYLSGVRARDLPAPERGRASSRIRR